MSSKRPTIGERFPNISASELRILVLEAEVLRLRDMILDNNYNMEKFFRYINTTLKAQDQPQPPSYSVESS